MGPGGLVGSVVGDGGLSGWRVGSGLPSESRSGFGVGWGGLVGFGVGVSFSSPDSSESGLSDCSFGSSPRGDSGGATGAHATASTSNSKAHRMATRLALVIVGIFRLL